MGPRIESETDYMISGSSYLVIDNQSAWGESVARAGGGIIVGP